MLADALVVMVVGKHETLATRGSGSGTTRRR
jgi:hypothetical protein